MKNIWVPGSQVMIVCGHTPDCDNSIISFMQHITKLEL